MGKPVARTRIDANLDVIGVAERVADGQDLFDRCDRIGVSELDPHRTLDFASASHQSAQAVAVPDSGRGQFSIRGGVQYERSTQTDPQCSHSPIAGGVRLQVSDEFAKIPIHAAKVDARHACDRPLAIRLTKSAARLPCVSSSVNLAFDIKARRSIEIPESIRAGLESQYHPDLLWHFERSGWRGRQNQS